MHTTNVRLLITTLENTSDDHFNMEQIYTLDGEDSGPTGNTMPKREGCGTAACIAGWCGWLATTDARWRPSSLRVNASRAVRGAGNRWALNSAAAWLGVTHATRDALFKPPGFSKGQGGLLRYPRLRAIDVLKDMLKTYEETGLERVRWDAFPYEGYAPKPAHTATPAVPAKPLPVELTRALEPHR